MPFETKLVEATFVASSYALIALLGLEIGIRHGKALEARGIAEALKIEARLSAEAQAVVATLKARTYPVLTLVKRYL